MIRRLQAIPALALAMAGLCLPTILPAGAAEGGIGAGIPMQLFASGGVLYYWDGASTELRPAPAGLTSGPRGFRFVLALDERQALLVEPAEQPPGKQKEKKIREGEVVVLGLGGPGAERGPVVSFEGAPSAAAVSPDGRRAYVLSWRGDPGQPGSRGWIHAIDVERGQIADSSLLSTPAFGIATDRTGGRLYLALKDRVQTYGADPVRVSWQYRSPGLNGPIAAAPEADLLAVGRGAEVALFDPARLSAVSAEERRARRDDATTVASLPFVVTRLAWSEDGSLLAVIGAKGLVFVDPANGALLWPPPPTIDFSGADDAVVLRFPGSDRDLVVGLAPGGTVSALRAPVPSTLSVPPPSPIVERPAQVAVAATPPPEPGPAAKQDEPAAKAAAPPKQAELPAKQAEPAPGRNPEGQAAETPKPAEPVTAGAVASAGRPPAPADRAGADPAPPDSTGSAVPDRPDADPAPAAQVPAPEPVEESGPPRLRGRISGKGARTIVLYGPNNILKEATRVEIQQDGTWSLNLPAPGTYRVVAIGDGSTPIPVVPTFRTVIVRAGIGESGLDFEIR